MHLSMHLTFINQQLSDKHYAKRYAEPVDLKGQLMTPKELIRQPVLKR